MGQLTKILPLLDLLARFLQVFGIHFFRGAKVMGRKILLSVFLILGAATVYGQSSSLSLDPLTFIQLIAFLLDSEEDAAEEPSDIRNVWLCGEVNWPANEKREIGVGLFARGDRFSARVQFRNFFNKERQSGLFGGLYGLVEYRKMYWFYGANNEIAIGYSYPFAGGDNVYHSIGLTAGFDIGFRIRGEKTGITPFVGLGLPLFYCFGSLPGNRDNREFYLLNAMLRAVDIGVRIDLIQ
jgi:hypothetical protein